MTLDVSPEIEIMIRQRAAAEGVSINDLLARTFAPDKESPAGDPIERVRQLLSRWQAEDHTPIVPPIPAQNGETLTQALFRRCSHDREGERGGRSSLGRHRERIQ